MTKREDSIAKLVGDVKGKWKSSRYSYISTALYPGKEPQGSFECFINCERLDWMLANGAKKNYLRNSWTQMIAAIEAM